MLTESQRSAARHDGGKDIANRKRYVAQVKSALLKMRNDCSGDSAALRELLTPAEIDTLTEAAHIVDRIVATLERDASEAKRIKTAWDKRCEALTAALRACTSDSPSDVVALLSLDRFTYLLRDIAKDCRDRWGGAREQLREARREVISNLVYTAARTDVAPDTWAAAIKAELPAHAAQHAALIAEIETIAAQQSAAAPVRH